MYSFECLVTATTCHILLPSILTFLSSSFTSSYLIFMSSLRSVERIDYLQLHRYGRKVLKKGGEKSTMEDTKLKELRLREDLKYSLEFYDLPEIDSLEEIDELIQTFSGLSREFRHTHVVLKNDLADKYEQLYPDYESFNDKCTKFSKDALKISKTLRSEMLSRKSKFSRSEAEKTASIRRDVLETKISHLKKSIDVENLKDIGLIDDFISKIEDLSDQYVSISGEFKNLFSDTYDETYSAGFSQILDELSATLKLAGVQRQSMVDLESFEPDVADSINADSDKYKLKIDNLSTEITMRASSLTTKLSCDLKVLTDHQILDLHQSNNIESDFNDILSKITDLSTLVCESGSKYQSVLDAATKSRDTLSDGIQKFHKSLQDTVTDRDISPDKLKNATTIQIDLQKFSGYDCKIDLYTFQSEFKKLIEPVVQKPYWADYLKNNYLEGPARILVDKEKDYDQIWKTLFASYGNTRLLMQNKLSELESIGGLWTVKGHENLALHLAKLLNAMKDLSSLASEHKIEGQLYEGGGLEKVMMLIGHERHKAFRKENLDSDFEKKIEWEKLSLFLGKELRLREKLALDFKTSKLLGFELKRDGNKNDSKKQKDSNQNFSANSATTSLKCSFCDGSGHVVITTPRGNKIIPYYVCEAFISSSCKERYEKFKAKNLCSTCLFPGAKKVPKHRCFFKNFCCPHPHGGEKIHVLLCEEHKSDQANSTLLEKFRQKFVDTSTVPLPAFSKLISCFSIMTAVARGHTNFNHLKTEDDISESAIFQFQSVSISSGEESLNILFDGGCGEMVVSRLCVEKLRRLGRAINILAGPINIIGVGDNESVSNDGVFSICLTLHDGREAELSGLCLPKITATLPDYELSVVENDLIHDYRLNGPKNGRKLPKLPKKVGGDTDILLGARYRRYFPQLIYQGDSGLGIYESAFMSPDGTRGVVTGPHKEFSKAENTFFSSQHVRAYNSFYTKEYLAVRDFWDKNARPLLEGHPGTSLCPDEFDPSSDLECFQQAAPSPGIAPPNALSCLPKVVDVNVGQKTPKCIKDFNDLEKTGTEVSYRCVDCRDCSKCKQGPRVDMISVQEELEQELIERSVTIDVDRCEARAKLPFLADPSERLKSSNESQAYRVYQSQVKKLQLKPDERKAVIESEQKLQDLGFVDYFDNLTAAEKVMITTSVVIYLIAWRVVWNLKSLSTPCRLVFDASLAPRDGSSLNSILAKGANSLNNLIEILIRFTTRCHAFHTDISKMYNRIWLEKEHWCYQMYLWSPDLNPDVKPVWKVIKTLIYGVRPSGQLAECAVRRVAELSKDKYPSACRSIQEDTYMDDCMSGAESSESCRVLMDEIDVTLRTGGFTVKGFVCSGEDPSEDLSTDGKTVMIGGLKWFTKDDKIAINVQDFNFAKKIRGKKIPNARPDIIPEVLTKRDCVSKCAELFDPLGRISPIIAGMKLDINLLHQVCLNWDDPIPNELKDIWLANFDLMREVSKLQFSRAVVPSDAVNLDMETIDMADAGDNLICAAIYVRFLRRNGSYSCQLIFSRSKIIHDLTTPRAELEAALLNATTGHVLKLSLKDRLKRCWKLTDSQVTLHWINCDRALSKAYLRYRKMEIERLTDRKDWFYTKRDNNLADLGTRKGAKPCDVDPGSKWINGLPWMMGKPEDFPIHTVDEISMSKNEKSEANREMVSDFLKSVKPIQCMTTRYVPEKVGDRYKFSKYLLDPNKFRFRKVIRIIGIVLLFILKSSVKLRSRRTLNCLIPPNLGTPVWLDHFVVAYVREIGKVFVAHLTDGILDAAKAYYFRKAALEVKQFVNARKYEKKSVWKDGILFHTGRILAVQEIDNKMSLADVCLDLSATSFCVPITDALSPVAYSIVSETHWYDPDVNHKGVESILRHAQQTAYIIEGRALVKSMKRECKKCRALEKRGLEIAMGPVSGHNLKIAPPFFICQVDICGPFDAFSPANKRATLKVWFTVFCCTVTCAVDCRVMSDYTADAFLMAFERFACRFSYPKRVLPDPGSQLIKGCKNMVISFADIKNHLTVEYGVEFELCPVGAHYVHGKVERKIQTIKKSLVKSVIKEKLSILQWETVVQQVSNNINNMPIGLGNKVDMLENLDILSPNRLILGRNNNRSPAAPLQIVPDLRMIIENNNRIFGVWFKEWLVSYVPTLVEQPKWFVTERNIAIGDVVLFLKSEKEFDLQYQFGIVVKTLVGKDGVVREVEVEYQNANETTKRRTTRGARDLVVIHQVDEIGISKELAELAQ